MRNLFHRTLRALMHKYPFLNGSGRIIDRTFLSRIEFDEETQVIQTRSGYEMRVFANDLIGRHLFLTGRFDPTNVAVLRAFARPGDHLLDVGANVGFVSCELLFHVPNLRVVAIEPQPDVFTLLTENLAQFGPRAQPIEAALSNQAGKAMMILDRNNVGASRLMTVSDRDDANHSALVEVNTLTAQQIVEASGFDRIDLVKIDVEGHEVAVFRSLQAVLGRLRPRAVLFEHDEHLSDSQHPIRQILDPLGYRISGVTKRLNGWALEPVSYPKSRPSTRRYHDYVAVEPSTTN